MLPKVGIILINYNNYLDTIECIESLRKITYPNAFVVVVDNGSQNESVKELAIYENQIKLIIVNENYGFSFGNNLGVAYAFEHDAEYVLLLNNDTVVEPDFLESLIEEADQNTITVPLIRYYNSKIIWSAGGYIDWSKANGKHYLMNKEVDSGLKVQECTFATGCCWLIYKEIWKKVGELDDIYFMYVEDLDYCIRAYEMKIVIKIVPQSIIYHKISRASGNRKDYQTYYMNRNRLYLIKKYKKYFGWKTQSVFFATRLIRMVESLLKRNGYKVYLRAYYDFKHGRMGRQS